MSYEFKAEDLWGLIYKIGGKTRQHGNEIQFETCPICDGGNSHDKWTFSINSLNGTSNCLRSSCSWKGAFVQLAREFDYPLDYGNTQKREYRKLPQRPVEVRKPALDYLESRGISREVGEKYKITSLKDNPNVVVFPFYDEQGTLQFIKYRNANFRKGIDKSKEWAESQTKPILFGMLQCDKQDHERLVITEGQLDSLSLATAKIKNAVSVPTGARGMTWVDHCYSFLERFKEIVIMGDCEGGKITLVDEIAKRTDKPIKVVQLADYLGEKDANDILRKYGAEALRTAVDNAKTLPVTNVKSLAEVRDIDLNTLPKIKTGIDSLDRVIGGMFYGQVILLSGKRGEGKSILASQLGAEALRQDVKCLFYSGELPDYHFKNWLDSQIAGRRFIDVNENEYGAPTYSIPQEYKRQINEWYSDKAFIYDNYSAMIDENETKLLTVIEQTIRRYGVKFVLLDNLMTAIDVGKSDEQYFAQSKFVKKLKQLAVKYDIVAVLVAHPRKTQGGTRQVTSNDEISGSADITNAVDVVMTYSRGDENNPDSGRIYITKNRLSGVIRTKEPIAVQYDRPSKRIFEPSRGRDFSYGWLNETKLAEKGDLPF